MQLHTKNDAIAYFWRCNCIKAPKVTIVILIKKGVEKVGFYVCNEKTKQILWNYIFFCYLCSVKPHLVPKHLHYFVTHLIARWGFFVPFWGYFGTFYFLKPFLLRLKSEITI